MAKLRTALTTMLGTLVSFVLLSFYLSGDYLNRVLLFEIFDNPEYGTAAYEEEPPPRLVTVMLTFDRPESLNRSLTSLEQAYYYHHPRTSSSNKNRNHLLKIAIDVPQRNHHTKWNSTSAREANRKCFEIAEKFDWTHGEKQIHLRARNAGLASQWFESWTPYFKNDGRDKEEDYFVHIVEDDLEFSPFYYKFIWDVQRHLKVFQDPDVAQICLTVVNGPGDPLVKQYPFKGHDFSCSWGSVWKASELRNFKLWLFDNFDRIKPYTTGDFNTWIDEGKDLQSIWTARYFQESKKKFLTFNLKRNKTVLSTSSANRLGGKSEEQRDDERIQKVQKEQVYLVINHAEIGVNNLQRGPVPNRNRLITQAYHQDSNSSNQLGNNDLLGEARQTTLFDDLEWTIIKQQLQRQREKEALQVE